MNTFHTRNHRYRISVQYIDNKISRFGKTETLVINRDTVDMFLKAFNPIKCKTWMTTVDTLRKRGYVNITTAQVEDGLRILKNIRIERN